MATERASSATYLALKKETTKGTAVTPDVYVPYFSQSLATDINLNKSQPIYGGKFRTFQSLQSTRHHTGRLVTIAEPNTMGYFFDMLFTKGTSSGSNPKFHPFTLSGTTDPNSYTMDLSLVSQVVRFFGVQVSRFAPNFVNGEMQAEYEVSALGSFYGAKIASISGSGTFTVTFETKYDPAPTTGLVAGDLISFKSLDGATELNGTIAGITDGVSITTTTDPATVGAGGMMVLRSGTPSFSLKDPFIWPRTQFRLADTAANALTATQTRLDEGTEIAVEHAFESDEGSPRSGGFDPASLVRTVGDAEFKIKKFFDEPEQIHDWQNLTKKALVMRAFSGDSDEYEMRITLNHIVPMTDETPTETEGVIYHEVEYAAEESESDGQAVQIYIANAITVI